VTCTFLPAVPPRVVEGVARKAVLVGATIQLQCMAEGTSPITWQWRNNTILVVGDDRVRVNGGQLTISNVQVSDSGVYQCIASHSTSGQDGNSNTVNVTSKKQLECENTHNSHYLIFFVCVAVILYCCTFYLFASNSCFGFASPKNLVDNPTVLQFLTGEYQFGATNDPPVCIIRLSTKGDAEKSKVEVTGQ